MIEKEYETKDEHDERDAAFWDANIVFAKLALGHQLEDTIINNAAEVLTACALNNGDHFELACFIVAFSDFVDANKPPPMAMLRGLRNSLERFRCETKSMDKAFYLNKERKGRPEHSSVDRALGRTIANHVVYWVSKGNTLEEAIEKTAEYYKKETTRISETKIKRDYLKYRKIKKSFNQ
ncbi:hypothetical protein W03_16540 [Nitrosomonas sp. PY1]|uniref:hypothetical protein n=1 Tax=Nitrosomonas sp. PY1 TaxID=1803906 RepID=UPI001FC7E7CD|nr:hypothetical protein [Nitrosomonas sp. PY1]GKS69650.1 hypothetical protein W03_16540 [Nitrosomonas sp. PY1]